MKRLSEMEAYIPGEQPQDKTYVKLNTNESPFPPAPEVVRVLSQQEIEKCNLYSDPTVSSLNRAIADFYDISPDRVFVGNGSDEVLAFSFQAFGDLSHPMFFPDITYGCYRVFAELYNIPFTKIPLDDSLAIRVEDYQNVQGTVVIANPNAQTGTYLSLDSIANLVQQNQDRLVIVDEAYIDFGGESCIRLTDQFDNLLVVQTFSKSRNLAGARVGFAVGNRNLIQDLYQIKYSFNPYNINRLSMLAAKAAIEDRAYFDSCRLHIIQNREWTREQLETMGFTLTKSKANFLLAACSRISGEELYRNLKSRGVLIRYFPDARIQNYIRITIGSAEQMQILIQNIKDILGGL
jgi:histidinol-phosphate aminotransferase